MKYNPLEGILMKKILLIAGGLLFVTVIIGAHSSPKETSPKTSPTPTVSVTSTPTTQETAATTVTQATPTPEQKQYEVLSRKDNGNVENISILVSVASSGEVSAKDVKKTCKKQCNIDVYDDKKAYDLNAQYDQMMGLSTTQSSDLTAWKEKNYVFVGDHYVGSIMFEDDSYNDYPFRDWYYKELKGE